MPDGASTEGQRLERKRHRAEEQEGGFTAAAQQRSLRFGAPWVAVDPLLSLLNDVRHLERRVLATLEELGVDFTELPAGVAPLSAVREASDVSGAGESQCAPPTEESVAPVDPINAYVAAGPAHAGVPTDPATQRVMAAEAVLAWLDMSAPEPGQTDTDAAEREASRRILAGLIGCYGEGDERPLILAEGARSLSSENTNHHSGNHQPQREPALRFASAGVSAEGRAAGEGMVSLGCFDAATVEGWSRYADGLSVAIAGMHSLLRSLCTTADVSAARWTHVKWREVSAGEGVRPFSVPSCSSIKSNIEQVIKAADALASCQVVMRDRFVSFEEALETYAEEAAAVCRIERRYWANVRIFECEYNALRAMKRRVSQVQKAFRREEGIPMKRSIPKGFTRAS